MSIIKSMEGLAWLETQIPDLEQLLLDLLQGKDIPDDKELVVFSYLELVAICMDQMSKEYFVETFLKLFLAAKPHLDKLPKDRYAELRKVIAVIQT